MRFKNRRKALKDSITQLNENILNYLTNNLLGSSSYQETWSLIDLTPCWSFISQWLQPFPCSLSDVTGVNSAWDWAALDFHIGSVTKSRKSSQQLFKKEKKKLEISFSGPGTEALFNNSFSGPFEFSSVNSPFITRLFYKQWSGNTLEKSTYSSSSITTNNFPSNNRDSVISRAISSTPNSLFLCHCSVA